MSDPTANPHALDPDRPWFTREEDLPGRMSGFDTFFFPAVNSSTLHFTRAWTVLFFAGVLTWVGLGGIIMVIGIAGADTSSMSAAHSYMVAIVLAVSCLLSYVIHTRRLNHAGKISLRALIVLVPLILASVAFIGGVSSKAAEYDELYDARAEFLADPDAWREARLEERRQQQAEETARREEAERAREAGEAPAEGNRGGNRGRGGPPGGWDEGPSAENPLPGKEEFIVRPNLGSFNMIIVLMNTLIMILTF